MKREQAAALKLRASGMPLALLCAAAVRPELRVDESNDAAAVGTAVHEALRRLAERGGLDWEGIGEIAERHGVDVEEVRALCAIATKLWPEVRASFPGAITEADLAIELDGALLTGHVDLISVAGDVARAGDWKTGRKDSDYSEQMKAYGTLVLLAYPQLREVTVTILWVRDQAIENYTMTRADAIAWAERVEREVVRWDGTYRPGPHCQHCPRSHECQAANALLRRDVAAIADRELVARVESDLASMAPAEVIELVAKARMVKALADRVCDGAKAYVLTHGDIVAEGVGRLTIDREQRRKVDAAKAWPVLEAAGFGDEEFAQVMTIGVSKVEKVVATRAGRGRGAAAVRALSAALADAGAVSTTEVEKLVQKRE